MAVDGLTCSLSIVTVFIILLVPLLENVTANINTQLHRRFEYKYSFKPPYLAQKDGTVPFWEYGGNAIASAESVRVAPSLRSQKGAIWTKSKTNFDWWETEIVFRVSGRGRIGADGLAIWYTSEKGDYNGEVFGASDQWTGLGVFFDSFDNDNKHNNPYIMAVLNDGTKKFDHQNDGTTQLLSGCLRDFRNKPFPTRARIEYYQNILTVLFHNGMTNNNDDYEVCLRAENVILPKNGYFGVSAATGGLADDHDVFHFLTTSLHPPNQLPDGTNRVPEEDNAKLSLEYQEYQKKVEQQKLDYLRDHPDQQVKEDIDDWYENDNQRELRQIWQAQSSMTEVLRDLSRKMDEVIGRQERTMGLISASPGSVPQVQHQGGTGGQIASHDTIRRHEIDMLINNQNIMMTIAREVRVLVGEIQVRADTVLSNQAKQGQAQPHTQGYELNSLVMEMRDGLNNIKQGVATVGQKISQQPQQLGSCPTQNCLGLTAFLICTVVQLTIMLAYSMFKESRDAKAKKFY